MTNGEYFVLTHPDVIVKENGTCVWIYNLDNTDCNHYTMSTEWWNEEMATVYEFKGCDNCELDRPNDKWILDSIGCYCSECKKHPDVTTDYCPFCGADMRGEIANDSSRVN